VRWECHAFTFSYPYRYHPSSELGGPQLFQKSVSDIKILGDRKLTWSKFHSEAPQILGATVQNLVDRATWRPGLATIISLMQCDLWRWERVIVVAKTEAFRLWTNVPTTSWIRPCKPNNAALFCVWLANPSPPLAPLLLWRIRSTSEACKSFLCYALNAARSCPWKPVVYTVLWASANGTKR
jgi:hypothetical protein